MTLFQEGVRWGVATGLLLEIINKIFLNYSFSILSLMSVYAK